MVTAKKDTRMSGHAVAIFFIEPLVPDDLGLTVFIFSKNRVFLFLNLLFGRPRRIMDGYPNKTIRPYQGRTGQILRFS